MANPIDIGSLTPEEIASLQVDPKPKQPQAAPAQPAPAGPINIGDLSPGDMKQLSVAPEGRALQMALNGLTFGARPRLAAAWKAGSFSGPEYEAAKKEEWAKDDAYAEANPVAAIGAEVAGSLPTMFVPGLGAARVAQAANRAGQAAQGLSRSQRFARALGVGSEIGSTGAEAGALGLKTAALTGGISSREDTATGKLGDAAAMAPLGYILGRGGQFVGERVARGAEHMTDAVRYGGDANIGALNAIQRGMTRDGVTPQAIREVMLPDTGRRAIGNDAKEIILRAYDESIQGGATDAAARRAARGAYRPVAQVSNRTADDHVRAVLDTHLTRNEIPLAIDELASTAGSRGQNLHWSRRAAMNAPGEGREMAAEAIMGRQEEIIPRMRERVVQAIGTPDFEGALNTVRLRNSASSQALYSDAYAREVPFDLSPVFDRWQRQTAFMGGPVRQRIDDALATMRGTPGQDGKYQRHTLESYIQSRGALNDLIADSHHPTTMRPTNATRVLMNLKREMDAIVARDNPAWVTANAQHAEGMAVENAMRRGSEMTLSPTARTRQSLRWLETASPDEQEAFRIGFARVLHNELSRLGDTHDASKIFLKGGRNGADGVRDILRRTLGDDVANDLIEMAQRARIATRTNQAYGNSQTTPLREAMTDQNAFGRILGLAQMLNPSKAVEAIGDMVGSRLNEGRNTELLRRYSVMSDRPAAMFDLIAELERLRNARAGAFTAPGVNAYTSGGLLGAGTGGAIADRRSRGKE